MGDDGESGMIFGKSFIDGRDELLLGAEAATSAESSSPRECHGIDERFGPM